MTSDRYCLNLHEDGAKLNFAGKMDFETKTDQENDILMTDVTKEVFTNRNNSPDDFTVSSLSLSEQIQNGPASYSKPCDEEVMSGSSRSRDTEVTCNGINQDRSQSCQSFAMLETNVQTQPTDKVSLRFNYIPFLFT